MKYNIDINVYPSCEQDGCFTCVYSVEDGKASFIDSSYDYTTQSWLKESGYDIAESVIDSAVEKMKKLKFENEFEYKNLINKKMKNVVVIAQAYIP